MAAPSSGQVAVSGTAQPLSAPISLAAFTIKAPASNQQPVFLGRAGVTTSTGHQLDPGDELDYQPSNQIGESRLSLGVSDFYVVGTSGDKVTWLGSP